jgi:endonuclease/exonuclease/phosphatase family metal-dependent hydrolase
LTKSFARGVLLAVAVLMFAAVPAQGLGHHHKPNPPKVKVMTRNLYLGADLGPGTSATSLQGLVDGAGQILNQVDDTNFPVRAKGLAKEIVQKSPDLVGLQEAALWRTAPCTDNPIPPSATTVRYDYLKLLLAQLNKKRKLYHLAVSEPEFDFEVWANTDGNESTSAPGCPFGSEINGRLTMRDAILARNGAVQTSKPKGHHYSTLLQVTPGGVPVDVTRGWVRVTAKVPHAPKFNFVDTHLEAFDNQASNHTNQDTDIGNGEVREAQAKELVAPGGPATGKLPVILVGDLNSDIATSIKPGDGLADQALLDAGFTERSTSNPLSCCIEDSYDLTTGSASDFDHKVDHVMTDDPKQVKLVSSAVTGRSMQNGYWDSDHAGLFSTLSMRK